MPSKCTKSKLERCSQIFHFDLNCFELKSARMVSYEDTFEQGRCLMRTLSTFFLSLRRLNAIDNL